MDKVYSVQLEEKWNKLVTIGKRTPGVSKDFNPLENIPEWFDLERFTNAQKLGKKYFLSLNISHFIGNILLVLLPDVHVPIIASGQNSSVNAVLKRVLSTVIHINSWYDDNPFDSNSSTYKSLRQVRTTCHMMMSKLMNEKYPKDHKMPYLDEDNKLWLSQQSMVMTQWSLIGLIAIRPENCAFYLDDPSKPINPKLKNTDQDKYYVLGEMIYFWRVIGYCMGIKDEFNCCSEATTEENINYLRICFERGYKPDLENPNALVKNGLRLVDGLFMGLNLIIPSFIITNNGFMKYWYEALGIYNHEFYLDKFFVKLSYYLHKSQFDYFMKLNPVYQLISIVFFYLLDRILEKYNRIIPKIEQKYGHLDFNFPDENGEPYSVINSAYKSNVKSTN